MDTDRANKRLSNKIAVWTVTPAGVSLGISLCRRLSSSILFLPQKEMQHHDKNRIDISLKSYTRLSEEIHRQYRNYHSHVFIFATGIAVRILAPLLESKVFDPAVVVMDETGEFAISLVSGHLGGANELAHEIAALTGAIPVITTATDSQGLTSVDMIAKNLNLAIETPENIKHVNMKLLRGDKITLVDPAGSLDSHIPESIIAPIKEGQLPDLFCGYTCSTVSRETLILRPRVLCLGIGCNRNTPAEEILDLIVSVFRAHQLSLFSIKQIGSSTVKEDEPGLIKAAKTLERPLAFYHKQDLNSVDTIKNPSEMAQKHLGVKSVCEAAAILGAEKGPLIIAKQKTKNVTLALALAQ